MIPGKLYVSAIVTCGKCKKKATVNAESANDYAFTLELIKMQWRMLFVNKRKMWCCPDCSKEWL